MKKRASSKKVANSLVAVSSAAVLAVYAAGYTRTQSAAEKFAGQTAGRRPAAPVPPPAHEVPAPLAVDVPAAKAPPIAVVKQLVASAKAAPVAAAAPEAEPQPAPSPVATTAVSAPPAAAEPAASAAPNAALPPWKDGRYEGWGSCRHGDIQAAVVIEGGRIVSATIAQCMTRYSCDIIDILPPQVAKKQSPNVDSVGGATQSADAFYYAVYDALSKAK